MVTQIDKTIMSCYNSIVIVSLNILGKDALVEVMGYSILVLIRRQSLTTWNSTKRWWAAYTIPILSNIQPTRHASAQAHWSTRYRRSLYILLWRHLDNSLKYYDPSSIVVTQLYRLLCPNSIFYCTLVFIIRANEDARVVIS